MIRRYLESGGNVTAEAVGNVYAISGELNLSGDWLNRFLEGFVPKKMASMSYQNLKDVI